MLFWRPQIKEASAAQVTVNGSGLSSGTVGEPCSFSIYAPSKATFAPTSCSVAFEGPSKPDIKFCSSPTHVECSWCPSLPGVYKVFVRYLGEEIPGSPFLCKIDGGLSVGRGHLRKIHCTGRGLTDGRVNRDNEVTIAEVAGVIGGLSVSMEGPGQPEMRFMKNSDNTLSLIYRTKIPGIYTLNIMFTGLHVTGSPFKVNVT
uniref:Uncharacterized protein n=1 Tax=Tetranychus urticae TaxID=32264 RepID=T1K6K2_TETUR